MMTGTMTRRRMIGISAAAAGMALLPPRGAVAADAVTWQGEAMGAQASLVVHHPDRDKAERLVEATVAEVRRLERIFSLYREDSGLTLLNRQGFLVMPPPEMVDILRQSRAAWELTGGAFDPTNDQTYNYLSTFQAYDSLGVTHTTNVYYVKDATAPKETDTKALERGQLRMDPERHTCTWKNDPVTLTVTEFLILQALATRPGVVKSRNALMDAAYDDQVYVDDRTIDSHIKRLRKKFKVVDDDFEMIETLYGVGYRFKES